MKQISLSTIAVLAFSFAGHSQVLNENFNEPFNPTAAGWIVTNNSSPAGSVSWTQGNQTGGNGTLTAYNGLTDDFYMADFLAVNSQGTISAWMITPTVTIYNGAVLEFATSTASYAPQYIYPDRLQVRMAQSTVATIPAGATSVGNFTTLMLDINPNLTTNYASAVNNGSVNGYPASWTVYQLTVSGVTGTVSGRFAFRYYVNDGGANGANSRLVGIDAVKYTLPCQPSVMGSYTTCANASTTLSAMGVPATTYSWSNGSTNSSIVVNPSSTTVYSLYPINSGSMCPNVITSTITVAPNMALTVNASTTTICAGTPVQLSVSGPASSFAWNTQGGSISTVTVAASTSVTPNTTTTYTVGAINGACTGSAAVTINVLPLPSLSVNISPVCIGSNFTITASGGVIYSYLGSTVNPQTVASPTAAGGYNFTLLGAGANGCIAGGVVTFSAYAPPTVSVAASKTVACVNQTLSLTASGADTYSWSSNASVSGTNTSITFSSATTGLKTFTVVGTSAVSGCKATAVKNVSVAACTGIEDLAGNVIETTVFPNPFTTELRIGALTGRVEIYNALGQLVISTAVSEQANINTSELAKGVYVVKALDRDGREIMTQRLLKN